MTFAYGFRQQYRSGVGTVFVRSVSLDTPNRSRSVAGANCATVTATPIGAWTWSSWSLARSDIPTWMRSIGW